MKITTLNPKKYKLIKIYPCSPRLGTEAIKKDKDAYALVGYGIYHSSNIENQPEYWQEITNTPEYVKCIINEVPTWMFGVIGKIYRIVNWNHSTTDCMIEGSKSSCSKRRFEQSTKEEFDAQFKDYEILSFISNNTKTIFTKQVTNRYGSQGLFTEESMLSDTSWSIHSVKRLSDGEVFTIGDKSCWKTISEETIRHFTISRFNISNNIIGVFGSDSMECFLNDLHKLKQPLFKTEDGILNKIERLEKEVKELKCAYDNKLRIWRKESRHKVSKSMGISKFEVYKEGLLINTYDSLMDCQRELGVNNANISRCLKGIYKQCNGYTFKNINQI